MDFFLEMLLTAILSLLFSFLVSKLVSLAMAGNIENYPTSDQAENPHDFVTKMNAPVVLSERNFQVVDVSVETVDRYGNEADRVNELEEAAKGNGTICVEHEELVFRIAEAESTAAVSEDIIVRGQEDQSDSAREIGAELEELVVRTTEVVSIASDSLETVLVEEVMIGEPEERRSGCVQVGNDESGDVVVAESEEVRVESSNAVEEDEYKKKWNSDEEKEELVITENDDGWEGIERSELEKAFTATANFLEESGKAEEIGSEAKMELYGLHKIATEGSCREAQPMALMVSARAKWNAWQKLGNMNQEEAMEKYLALVSKEIPSCNEY